VASTALLPRFTIDAHSRLEVASLAFGDQIDPHSTTIPLELASLRFTTAAANPAGIEAGIRTRTFPANSTSFAGTVEHAAPSRPV
jgi:hypothetical protein